ncbi:MAG: hypothetical protein IPQ24_07005 [Anaeromyxobacter sp.]|nr:hypothetical protein [Anaeromyxobacter sp.]
MKRVSWMIAAALVTTLAACGSSSDPAPTPGFPQPAGTIAVNFKIDDTANQVWKTGELEWKGQVQFDPTTRIAQYNSDWNAAAPGWAKLYDDGPWNADPAGHEPAGAVAGDHVWGVTVFIAPPTTAPLTFGYGLRDATNPDRANGGWVWIGNAGEFSIPVGATGPINVPGLAFPAAGTNDMKLVIDTNALAASDPPWVLDAIAVKGSAWGWSEKVMYDDGPAGAHGDDVAADGKYTFILSAVLDTTHPPYPALLATGDQPEFVFVLGGAEYKVGVDAALEGVTGFVKPGAGAWTTAPVTLKTGGLGGKNTIITVP